MRVSGNDAALVNKKALGNDMSEQLHLDALGVDAETGSRLEALGSEYCTDISAHYEETAAAFAGYITSGKLPGEYRLPGLNYFIERLSALAPTRNTYQRNGWQPKTTFVPQNLSFDQWDDILTGHELPDGHLSEGAWRNWDDNQDSLEKLDDAGTKHWEVAIISSVPRLTLRSISPDGAHGPNAKSVIRALSTLIPASDTLPPSVVMQRASPSLATYFSLQHRLLLNRQVLVDTSNRQVPREDEKEPMDTFVRTILSERVTIERALPLGEKAVVACWDPTLRKFVALYCRLEDATSGKIGVRPTESGKNLVWS